MEEDTPDDMALEGGHSEESTSSSLSDASASKRPTTMVTRKFVKRQNALISIISSLWNQSEFSDVLVVIGAEQFHCHKAILAGWSRVFRAMFSSGMAEAQENQVKIAVSREEEV